MKYIIHSAVHRFTLLKTRTSFRVPSVRMINIAVFSLMILLCFVVLYTFLGNEYEFAERARLRAKSMRPYERWGTDYLPLGELKCNPLFFDDAAEQRRAYVLEYNGTEIMQKLRKENYSCSMIQRTFKFFDEPLSKEEEDFPLAYGMIVHSELAQIFYLLSAIYQPQNQFCIAVDGKSSDEFFRTMKKIAACYPNIHVQRFQPIYWGGYEILNAVHGCLSHLTKLKKPWKYYQYLSGVDAPLKTNLEMVRIFKALNGSMNAEILPYDRPRLMRKDFRKAPLRLIKTSLSATFSRETADVMINHPKAKELLEFISWTALPDEAFWGSVAGNPDQLLVPGGFDGNAFLLKNFPDVLVVDKQIFFDCPRDQPWAGNFVVDGSAFPKTRYNIDSYYISRYQQWEIYPGFMCKGKWVSSSCVYGVHDLPNLMRRHELIAHKFYMNFQPAAFLCVIHEIRRRSLNPVNFTGEEYRYLPDAPIRTA